MEYILIFISAFLGFALAKLVFGDSEVKELAKKNRKMIEVLADKLGVTLYWHSEDANVNWHHGDGAFNILRSDIKDNVKRIDDETTDISGVVGELGKALGLEFREETTECGWVKIKKGKK